MTFELSSYKGEIYRHLFMIDRLNADGDLDPKIAELTATRISQIRGCAYCLQLHTSRARRHGVRQEQLDLLPAWRGAHRTFSPAERSAIAFAEAAVSAEAGESIWAELKPHFTEEQIASLVVLVGMTQAWTTMLRATGLEPEPGTEG